MEDNTRQGTVTEEQKTGQQQGADHQHEDPQEGHQRQPRTFTEEEVNDIVRKRLNREREKLTKAFEEGTRESDLDERERKILKRELRADTLEKLAENGMPAGLADLVNYDSAEECEKSLATVSAVFNQAVNEAVRGKARQSTPRDGGGYTGRPDPLAGAFGLKR
ncbi:DUF4355 domain-containing protein [uncultured Merdimonas sp.]|uniref:capsid assembly scaffolding protein Gp46 family protein n=1 Tax=uncultured Merdimonas sp. TaxID=2023269 RepID=UPI00320828CC